MQRSCKSRSHAPRPDDRDLLIHSTLPQGLIQQIWVDFFLN